MCVGEVSGKYISSILSLGGSLGGGRQQDDVFFSL